MPYLMEWDKDRINDGAPPQSPGELNYALTAVCLDYLALHGISYAKIAEVVAALECAKLEFYRRVASPYEQVKQIQNGDVYPKRNSLGWVWPFSRRPR